MKSVRKLGIVVVFVVCATILIWIAVALAPTTPPPSEAELENYFGDDSCSWPCWQGITPGVTTSNDALQLIQNSSLVSQSTVQTESSKKGFGTAHWEWKIGDEQPPMWGDMEGQDGIVRTIELGAYPTFSIGEVINKFGSPDKIDVIDCTDFPEQKYRYFCGTMYYTKRGFNINITWEVSWNDNDKEITPYDPISFVVLLQPSTIEEWVAYYGGDPQTLNLQDWKGYGNLYELYYR